MANLATTGGATITFVSATIDAIADHNDTTGAAVTCVYGIPPTMLMVDETVQAFMQRLAIAADFAQLTRPNGWPIWIRGSSVTSLRPPAPGEFASEPTVKTIVAANSSSQAVRETLTECADALRKHGGKL